METVTTYFNTGKMAGNVTHSVKRNTVCSVTLNIDEKYWSTVWLIIPWLKTRKVPRTFIGNGIFWKYAATNQSVPTKDLTFEIDRFLTDAWLHCATEWAQYEFLNVDVVHEDFCDNIDECDNIPEECCINDDLDIGEPLNSIERAMSLEVEIEDSIDTSYNEPEEVFEPNTSYEVESSSYDEPDTSSYDSDDEY